jgi:hypothetical protein
MLPMLSKWVKRLTRQSALDISFSRSNFKSATDLQGLCERLAEILTTRVRAAKNLHMEIEWIVADLRNLGHNVKHWDGVIANWDGIIKDDPYLWVWIEGVDLYEPDEIGDDAKVGVSFRPRVPDKIAFRCPLCWSEMQDRQIRLTIQGHGSVAAPSVEVHFECPGLKDIDGPVGIASMERRRGVRVCTSCGAGLLLPVRS